MNACRRNVARLILFTWSAGLTKLKIFFNVLEAWCHCDFRKIEALKVSKFGRTYHTGGLISRCDELFLLPKGSLHILEAIEKFWFDGSTHRSH